MSYEVNPTSPPASGTCPSAGVGNGRRLRRGFCSRQPAQAREARRNIVQPRQAMVIDAQAHPFQARQLGRRRAAAPHHDDVRMQCQDALQVEALRVADALDSFGRLRLVGVRAGADHALAGPGRKQHRGRTGGQAHDALRGPRQLQRVLIVIVQRKRRHVRGLRQPLQQREQQGRRRQQARQLWACALQSKNVAPNTAASAACTLASGSTPGMQAL